MLPISCNEKKCRETHDKKPTIGWEAHHCLASMTWLSHYEVYVLIPSSSGREFVQNHFAFWGPSTPTDTKQINSLNRIPMWINTCLLNLVHVQVKKNSRTIFLSSNLMKERHTKVFPRRSSTSDLGQHLTFFKRKIALVINMKWLTSQRK
jgi:hypothetical protein